MTVQEIESAHDAGQLLDISRNAFEVPELQLHKMFYPLGFPVQVRTNSAEILAIFAELWGAFSKLFKFDPVQVDVCVVDSGSMECPPGTRPTIMMPHLTIIADSSNFSVANLEQNRTQIVVSRAALANKLYLRQHFLYASPLCHIVTRYVVPVHAGCVALDGRGMLLCGDSGAGKSSLSYACARAGWTFITDDLSMLLNDGSDRAVTGDCTRVRLRPSAAELFPEISGLKVAPRAAGKPSIEMRTSEMSHVISAPSAAVDFMIFLKRSPEGKAELRPYHKEVARYYMRQNLYGPADSIAVQHNAIERMLTAQVLELRYSSLEDAICRLQTLAQEGH
jgi:serine kinase of HPr protein (carbohydrate metabolism regulator)